MRAYFSYAYNNKPRNRNFEPGYQHSQSMHRACIACENPVAALHLHT